MLKFSQPNDKLRKTAKKLGKRLASFNLPAGRSRTGKTTCPFAGACSEWCYAKQGNYRSPSVQDLRERNLASLLALHRAGGVAAVRDALVEAIPPRTEIVRIHDSGDFFAPWYLAAWIGVATIRSDVTFYTYTKSFGFVDFDALPSNLKIAQSVGSTRDDAIDMTRPHSRVFHNHNDRVSAGYVDGTETDEPAIIGTVRIGLVYHGNAKAPESLRIES